MNRFIEVKAVTNDGDRGSIYLNTESVECVGPFMGPRDGNTAGCLEVTMKTGGTFVVNETMETMKGLLHVEDRD